MNKKQFHVSTIILTILAVLTIAFIFIRSMQSMEDSSNESRWVMELLRPLLSPIVGPENFTENLVRKLAHFTEFAALGAELMGLLITWRRVKLQGYVNVIFMAMGTALLDETIQIFSGRGPAIVDVWIDTAGAVFGIIVVSVIRLIIKSAHKSNK